MDDEVLIGGIEKRRIYLVEYDPSWPKIFIEHERRIRNALESKVSAVEHVGSTSVPGLAAKPIIDIIVVVADSSKEDTYLPQLVWAGYLLRVREKDWHQHRMFRTPELDVHIHIFSEGCPEILRQISFRNRLRNVAVDRLLYESVKRELVTRDWEDMNAYAREKSSVVEEITARALPERPLQRRPDKNGMVFIEACCGFISLAQSFPPGIIIPPFWPKRIRIHQRKQRAVTAPT